MGCVPFHGAAWLRPVYFGLLVPHIVLAALVVPLALTTIHRAWCGPLMFDFGIADLVLLGPGAHEVYLVEFRCRCAVIVARGQVIRRTRGFSLVCEHVSAAC